MQAALDEIEAKRKELGISRRQLSLSANMQADYWSHMLAGAGAINPGAHVILRINAVLRAAETKRTGFFFGVKLGPVKEPPRGSYGFVKTL